MENNYRFRILNEKIKLPILVTFQYFQISHFYVKFS